MAMFKFSVLLTRSLSLALPMLLLLSSAGLGWAEDNVETVPDWIWAPEHRAGHVPQTACYFRKSFELTEMKRVTLAVAADDHFELYLNGRRIGEGIAAEGVYTFDVTHAARRGDNTVAVKVENREGATAGLAARLTAIDGHDRSSVLVTDASWKASLAASLWWTRPAYLDLRWQLANKLGPFNTFSADQQEKLRRDKAAAQDAGVAPGNVTPAGTVGQGHMRRLSGQPAAGQHLVVPREFAVQQLAGHADVGSVTALTFDEDGQLIVAREDGQLWLLVDQDQDQQFDAMRDLGQLTKTCQGLLALNGQLYVTGLGDAGQGLYRLNDSDGDGRMDQIRQIVAFQGDNLEHGPHGIVLGPDGLLYVVVGNHSPLKSPAAATSPYRYAYEGDLLQPRFEDPGGHATGIKAPGGYVLRTDPDGERVEIVAAGLRNAYDLAVNRHAEWFTHDSDMESDRGTTWYRPTRVCHVIDGAEFGWRSGWSKWPDYYLDSLPAIADTGRGSPTGMVVYDHRAFPATYQDALFSCDWSEGRIWVIRFREQGAGLATDAEVFIQGTPLNVTDIEVGPDGALYFATGGRGTAGNVFRVSWKGRTPLLPPMTGQRIEAAVRQPQLHTAWARKRVSAIKQQLGADWAVQLEAAARDRGRSPHERLRALQIMQWLGPAPDVELLTALTRDEGPEVRRQATYFLSLRDDATAVVRLGELLADGDAVVQRRACEGLARIAKPVGLPTLAPLLASPDRVTAWAARRVLETAPLDGWKRAVLQDANSRVFLVGATALALASPDTETSRAIFGRCLEFMDGFLSDDDFVDMLRLQQLTLARAQLKADDVLLFRQRLADEYPSSSARINRELIRLLVYLQADEIIDRYVRELAGDWPFAEKLHLAMHLTFLKSGWSTPQKMAVFQYLSAPAGVGNSVPGYLQNAALQFGRLLSDEELATALQNGQQNPSAALAALLRMPERLTDAQVLQIQSLDERLAEPRGESANRLRVAIVAVLARDGGPAACRYLREIYDRDPTRRVEVALGLAESADTENWAYLVRSLPLLEPGDARQMLLKLQGVRQWPANAEAYRQVILVAQRLADQGAPDAIALLEHWRGYAPRNEPIPWQTALEAWKSWFTQTYPDQPPPELIVSATGGKWDGEALLKHLTLSRQEGVGSAEAGRAVFVKAQCANCHRVGSEGETMGPELTGLGKRFLPREILDSMLYPSKVISDQYAAKIVLTTSGKTYTGIVAEGAGDELMVLQADGKKVRLPKGEVDEIEPSGVSAMPEGLLDQLTLEEITDLFAFLLSDTQRVTAAAAPLQR